MWILGHTGIKRNERADALAKEGLNKPDANLTTDSLNLQKRFREEKLRTWQVVWFREININKIPLGKYKYKITSYMSVEDKLP